MLGGSACRNDLLINLELQLKRLVMAVLLNRVVCLSPDLPDNRHGTKSSGADGGDGANQGRLHFRRQSPPKRLNGGPHFQVEVLSASRRSEHTSHGKA